MQIDEKFRDIQEILMREDLFTHVGKVKRISGMMFVKLLQICRGRQ